MANTSSSNPFAIDYSKLGKSDTGRAWLEKAIHPPGSALTAVRGMPDNEAFPSTVTEYRNTYTLSPPTGATTTWNVLILTLPSPEIPMVYWAWNAGATPPTSSVAPVVLGNGNYNFTNWDGDVSRWRRLYGSLTLELDAPSLNDQGMVYCAQQRLEQMELAAPAGTATEANMRVNATIVDNLPSTPQLLQQLSPGFYKQKAKEGCFTVSGLCQPTNLYTTGENVVMYFGNHGDLQNNPMTLKNINTGRTQGWGGTTYSVTTGYSNNWSASWVLVNGVSINATIELKAIHAYEMQASVGSTFTLFTEQSAEPDTAAIDAYFALRHGMQDGYPASYNFFGTMLAGLSSLVPKIATWLLPVAKQAVPLIGQAMVNASKVPTPLPSVPMPPAPVPAPRAPPVAAPRRLRPVTAPTPAPRTSIANQLNMLDELKNAKSRLANLESRMAPRATVEYAVPVRRIRKNVRRRARQRTGAQPRMF